MSLNDFCAEHVSQRKHNSENKSISNESSTSGSLDCNSTPYKRRRQTNQALEVLEQLIKDSPTEEIDEKLNKNDILGLTIARLLRRKYLPLDLVNPNIHLQSYMDSSKLQENYNGFLFVLNTSGRILFMSDSVEYHLRKNVRSLYSQLSSIFQCIHQENHDMMKRILDTRSSDDQHLICTWNLPRGKRPSRAQTEFKNMLITGHYVYLHTDKDQHQQEPLFLAKCEQIISSTPNTPTNTQGSSSNTIIRFILNDNLQINEVSANIKTLLNYQSNELNNVSLSYLITSEFWNDILQAKENCVRVQHCTTMNLLTMYTSAGDRLTFLSNFYSIVEGKRKPVKFCFIVQLIDPLIRNQCEVYIKKQNTERLKSTMIQELVIPENIFTDEDASNSVNTDQSSFYNSCFPQNTLSKVSSITVIPQRRKRRNLHKSSSILDQSKKSKIQLTSAICDERRNISLMINSNSSSPSSDNSTFLLSPVQEITFTDGLFSTIDEAFVEEKTEFNLNFSLTNDLDDMFGINTNYHQSLFLATPTLTSCSFFA